MENDLYVIGYSRLSKDDPHSDESSSIHYQKIILSDFVKNHSELSDYEYRDYSDDGYSGSNLERPGIQEVFRLVRENKVHCIVVKDISRFSRDYIDVQKYLERIFPALDVRFIALNENYDSAALSGKPLEMAMKFKSILADYYCKDTSEKIINQLNAMKAQGKYIAGSPPFGYCKSKEDKYKLVEEPEEAAVVRKIFGLALDGMNINEIARQLNEEEVPTALEFAQMRRNPGRERTGEKAIWSPKRVHSVLTNEVYIGTMIYNRYRQEAVSSKRKVLLPSSEWSRIYNNHEPIVSKEDFDKIQDRYSSNVNMQSRGRLDQDKRKETYPLIDKVFCGGCRRVMRATKFSKGNLCMICHTRKMSDRYDCYDGYFSISELEAFVLRQIRAHIKEIHSVEGLTEQELKELSDRISAGIEEMTRLREQRLACENQLQELLIQKHREAITTAHFMEQKALLDVERNSLMELIREKEQEVYDLRHSLEESTRKAQEIAAYGSLDVLTRKLVESLIDKIYVYPGDKMRIIWNK